MITIDGDDRLQLHRRDRLEVALVSNVQTMEEQFEDTIVQSEPLVESIGLQLKRQTGTRGELWSKTQRSSIN